MPYTMPMKPDIASSRSGLWPNGRKRLTLSWLFHTEREPAIYRFWRASTTFCGLQGYRAASKHSVPASGHRHKLLAGYYVEKTCLAACIMSIAW